MILTLHRNRPLFAAISSNIQTINLSQVNQFIIENNSAPLQIQIGYPAKPIVNKCGAIRLASSTSKKIGLDQLLSSNNNASDIYRILQSELGFQGSFAKKNNTAPTFNILSFEKYGAIFKKLMDEIQYGNIYEINYCIPAQIHPLDIDGPLLFAKLLAKTHAPYCNYLETEHELYIGFSPELFLQKKGNMLTAKPMKGTRKRFYNDLEKDNAQKQELATSLKERAENVMIVDLMRNDMSKIAKPKTVEVEHLFEIETFATVHQMTSTINCELKNGIGFSEIIEALFPTGSMTGAPKHSAMQLIDQTELLAREWFAGCSGVIYENGDFDLSVNIRCLMYNKLTQTGVVWAGSAITAYANEQEEYNECLLKMKPILDALQLEP